MKNRPIISLPSAAILDMYGAFKQNTFSKHFPVYGRIAGIAFDRKSIFMKWKNSNAF